jgi:hypothetical protein
VLWIFFAAWMGLLFAWCGAARVRLDGPWTQPTISLVGLYLGIILIPATAYLFLAHPAWFFHYLFDPQRVPRLAVIPLIALLTVILGAAYVAGVRLIRSTKAKHTRWFLLGGALALGGAAVLLRERLGSYGTFEEYRAGNAATLGEVKLGYVLIALVVGVVAAASFVSWELWKDSKRVAIR